MLSRCIRYACRTIEKYLVWLDKILAAAVGATLVSTTIVLIINAFGRSIPGLGMSGGPTLAGLLVVWLTFLGSYLAVRRDMHITIDLFGMKSLGKWSRPFTIVFSLLAAMISLDVAILGYAYAASRFNSGQIDQMLFISSGWFYLPVFVGFALCAIAWLQKALLAAFDYQPKPLEGEQT